MKQRTAISVVCVFFLLCAQFGALTHALSHALGLAGANTDVVAVAQNAGLGTTPQENEPSTLCAFDLAFGQVLGGVHGDGAPLALVSVGSTSALDIPAASRNAEALAPKSRGPPVFS